MRVAFGEAGVLGGIEAGVHAGEDRETAGGWKGEGSFVAEGGYIGVVTGENFGKYGHQADPSGRCDACIRIGAYVGINLGVFGSGTYVLTHRERNGYADSIGGQRTLRNEKYTAPR
ncbi:hypothetical protein GOEFS_115_00780 [Gordonia effusa NBRC 100432]|uniref:Uncharacterized protein n=1 Tax=Gordonia effusa NBRC 100432 TaxID=1077974 RepID=H0R5T7_9ACTN|nr:hypothetical protein GOEFS_115_00780 [Gordonia effusa NBRC 100432]